MQRAKRMRIHVDPDPGQSLPVTCTVCGCGAWWECWLCSAAVARWSPCSAWTRNQPYNRKERSSGQSTKNKAQRPVQLAVFVEGIVLMYIVHCNQPPTTERNGHLDSGQPRKSKTSRTVQLVMFVDPNGFDFCDITSEKISMISLPLTWGYRTSVHM